MIENLPEQLSAYLVVLMFVFSLFWYMKSWKHPKKFPPGPKFPIPIFGDGYVLGKDLPKGLSRLCAKYGKVCGIWLGSTRAVVVSDFDVLNDILNKSEAANRQEFPAGFVIGLVAVLLAGESPPGPSQGTCGNSNA